MSNLKHRNTIFITTCVTIFLAVLINSVPIIFSPKKSIEKSYSSLPQSQSQIKQNFSTFENDLTPFIAITPNKTEVIPKKEKITTTVTTRENENTSKEVKVIETITPDKEETENSFFDVPFFSQFKDISSSNWQKVGCGIASLGMIINYYEPKEISVNALLNEGINSGAYINDAGWSHQGLANLADKHGLVGSTYDFSASSMEVAFAKFENSLKEGPVIASVHYTFDPSNPIPHLAVINGIEGDTLHYSDPAEGQGTISVEKFKRAWKKRYIKIRPSV